MMTFEEQMARIDSVRNVSSAVHREYMKKRRTAEKLDAYNTLLEPPANIREGVAVQANRLRKDMNELHALAIKLGKIQDKLFAMPSQSTITNFDGSQRVIIHKGILPDFEESSEDEAQALKMLEEFYARETA
ncbi:MAG: hypothetical protein IJG24_06645 [Selenomonadaceae bacterium]|nr:hypothetical protein [Selenomonadaceae bacterium]